MLLLVPFDELEAGNAYVVADLSGRQIVLLDHVVHRSDADPEKLSDFRGEEIIVFGELVHVESNANSASVILRYDRSKTSFGDQL